MENINLHMIGSHSQQNQKNRHNYNNS